MMGNNVNIAARLEGVNKVYASWILVSESTWDEANSGQHEGELVARRLDQVRVMGINKPVQLYNIMGFTAEMTEDEKKSVEVFHQGLDLYLQRQFTQAIERFQEAGRLNPEDKAPESPLDVKEIQPVHSEGDQPWDFFGRNDAKAETPVLWPPHAKC